MLAIGMAKLELNFSSSLTHHVQCPSKRRGMWLTEFYYPKFSPHPLTRSKYWTKNWRTNRKQMTDSLISSQSLMPLRLSDVWIFSFLFVFFFSLLHYYSLLKTIKGSRGSQILGHCSEQRAPGADRPGDSSGGDHRFRRVQKPSRVRRSRIGGEFETTKNRSRNMPRVNDLIFSFIISG